MPVAFAYDWHLAYRPACLALLAGQSPYMITSEKFANAPWALLPLLPLAMLPEWLGWILMCLISILTLSFVAYTLGANKITLIAFMLSPFVVRCLYYGQIDWIPLMGVVLPPWLGLFFIAVKPQTCGLVAIYWLFDAWKAGTIIKTFAPVATVTLLSFIPFGFWPAQAEQFGFNNALWPGSILVSVAMLLLSIHLKNKTLSASASPFMSPYFTIASCSSFLLPLLRYQWIIVAAVIIAWLIEVVR